MSLQHQRPTTLVVIAVDDAYRLTGPEFPECFWLPTEWLWNSLFRQRLLTLPRIWREALASEQRPPRLCVRFENDPRSCGW